MELELADESSPILYASLSFSRVSLSSLGCILAIRYRIGETFVHLTPGKALKRIAHDADVLNDEISKIATDAESCEDEMKKLKVTLYAKFGSAINLDE